jgi:hypothetical protein
MDVRCSMGQGGAIIQQIVKTVTDVINADQIFAPIPRDQEWQDDIYEDSVLGCSPRNGALSAANPKSAGKATLFTCSSHRRLLLVFKTGRFFSGGRRAAGN